MKEAVINGMAGIHHEACPLPEVEAPPAPGPTQAIISAGDDPAGPTPVPRA